MLPSHLPTKDTVTVGSGWGMGSLGGWLSEGSFAGARLRDDLLPDMGGRLYGTGAGFNTWQNRADKPTRGAGFSVGPSITRVVFGKIQGASISPLVSPPRGWVVQDNDIKPVIRAKPTPYIEELQVAAQKAAQVRRGQLVAAPPASADYQFVNTGQSNGRVRKFPTQYGGQRSTRICG